MGTIDTREELEMEILRWEIEIKKAQARAEMARSTLLEFQVLKQGTVFAAKNDAEKQ